MSSLKQVSIPSLWDSLDVSEIKRSLEELAMCAFYLAGGDQMGLQDFVEFDLDTTMDEYDPEQKYTDSLDALVDAVGHYNHSIKEFNLRCPFIDIVVDMEQTSLLDPSSGYEIYSIVPVS